MEDSHEPAVPERSEPARQKGKTQPKRIPKTLKKNPARRGTKKAKRQR